MTVAVSFAAVTPKAVDDATAPLSPAGAASRATTADTVPVTPADVAPSSRTATDSTAATVPPRADDVTVPYVSAAATTNEGACAGVSSGVPSVPTGAPTAPRVAATSEASLRVRCVDYCLCRVSRCPPVTMTRVCNGCFRGCDGMTVVVGYRLLSQLCRCVQRPYTDVR